MMDTGESGCCGEHHVLCKTGESQTCAPEQVIHYMLMIKLIKRLKKRNASFAKVMQLIHRRVLAGASVCITSASKLLTVKSVKRSSNCVLPRA